MTHTYSRGCFKLIFRKCLSYTPPTLRVAGTHTYVRSLSRSPAFSRFRTIERYYNTSTPTLLPPSAVFSGLRCFFPSYFPSFSYPFSSTSSSFTPFSHPSLHPFSSLALAFFLFLFFSHYSFTLCFLYDSFPSNFIFYFYFHVLSSFFFVAFLLLLVFPHIGFFYFYFLFLYLFLFSLILFFIPLLSSSSLILYVSSILHSSSPFSSHSSF